MTTTTNLTTATPAEIDAILAPIASAEADAFGRAYEYSRSALRSRTGAAYYTEQAEKAQAVAEAKREEAAPYRAEFTRRGGWTRIFWCTNNGGHAHSSLSCSTLRPTTQMVWLPELSGKTEAELVELAGESACSVCYPSAPAIPSQLRPAREAREAKAARDEELAVKRAAKAAKEIRNADGSQVRGEYGVVNTVVSAWQEIVTDVADTRLYGYQWTARKQEVQDRIVEALALKLGQSEAEIRETLEVKVAAKVKRDSRG